MNKKQNSNRKYLFWFVFLLSVSVVATSILTTMLMNKYYFDASGAIDIGPQNPDAKQEQPIDSDNAQTSDITTGDGSDIKPSATVKPFNPGFQSSSDGAVWTTNTMVDIFKSSYQNKQGQFSVKSEDGVKIIAPGTSNSFVFKLQNTGDVPLDYAVDIDTFTSDGYTLPVQARLSRYDGKWVLGDEKHWDSVDNLNEAFDTDTLAAGSYTYYTLDWRWKFDGNDEWDTMLGDVADYNDINLTIQINTSATETMDPRYAGGIKIPDTGDNASLVIWGTVAICSLVIIVGIIIFMILLKRWDDDKEDSAVEDTQSEKDKKTDA